MKILLIVLEVLSFVAAIYFWVSACLIVIREDNADRLSKARIYSTIICAIPALFINIIGFILMAFFI